MALTYFPPMTSGSMTTSWIPFTTSWPGNRGDGSTNFYWGYSDPQFSAWLPDDASHSWSLNYYPPEITATWLANRDIINYDGTVSWGLAPFIGCPTPFTAIQTVTGVSSATGTICCPPSYSLFTPGQWNSGVCTSTYTEDQISYSWAAGEELDTTYWLTSDFTSDSTTVVTTTGSSVEDLGSALVIYSTLGNLTGDNALIITAPAITGWNFPAGYGAVLAATTGTVSSDAASTTSSSTSSGETDKIPTGAIAGIAVASVFAGLGIVAGLVLLYLLIKTRRRLAEAEALMTNAGIPSSKQMGGTSSVAYTPSLGPAFSRYSNANSHMRQHSNGFDPSLSGHSPPPSVGLGPSFFQQPMDQPYQPYHQVPQNQEHYDYTQSQHTASVGYGGAGISPNQPETELALSPGKSEAAELPNDPKPSQKD